MFARNSCILLVLAAPALADRPRSVAQRDFERMAAAMPYLSLNAALYGYRGPHRQVRDPARRKAHWRILAQAKDRKYATDALVGLLEHSDPKVRTLAAVALFDRDDPSLLPAIAALCSDRARTFGGYSPISMSLAAGSPRFPEPERVHRPMTVARVAGLMVEFYTSRAAVRIDWRRAEEQVADYWERRRHRAHCIGWYRVQLARAGQESSPTRKDRIPRIRALRRRIDRLPLAERAWVLLMLRGEVSDAWPNTQTYGGCSLTPDVERKYPKRVAKLRATYRDWIRRMTEAKPRWYER